MSRVREFLGWSDVRSAGLQLWRPLVAELVGTELLVLLAVGAGIWNPESALTISLAAGFTVAVVIESVAHISGGHINPAVTAGVIVAGQMSLLRGLLYVIAQLLGALLGAGMLLMATPSEMMKGATRLSPEITSVQGMTIECLITFVLVFAALATLDPNRTDVKISPPYVIGLSVAIGHFYALRATGASMNPARSFGPAIVLDEWTDHWVYWLGPLSGGMSAAFMYKFAFAAPSRVENTQPNEIRQDDGNNAKNQAAESGC